MNPIKQMLEKTNPQQLVMNFIGQNTNPMFQNLIQMAQKGDVKNLENFARNLYKEQGRNFDKEFAEFMSNFKK